MERPGYAENVRRSRIRELREQRARQLYGLPSDRDVRPRDLGLFTIAAVAQRIGVTERTLRHWEAGTATPTARHRRLLARELRVPVEELEVGRAGDQPPEALKPLAAGIIVRGDRVLLTERRFPGHGEEWSWPSGKVEAGESLEEALLRELKEELLLTEATILAHVGDIDLPSGYRMSHYSVVLPEDAEPKLNDYEQLSQIQWMTRDEAALAFKTLPPHIAARALAFLDQVLAGEVERPVLVAAVIPHPEGRAQVLMTGRRYAEERVWSWPSGHVEAGERPVDAVIREVEEELVIADPRVVRHLGDVDTRADVSRWWGHRFRYGYVMHHFQLSVAAPNVAVIDHEELLVAEWRTLDQVVAAVATLPPELAEAAVKFARMAAAGPVRGVGDHRP